MKRFAIMRAVVGGVAALAALAVFATAGEAMQSYKWKKRPLVVFADSDGSSLLAAQRQIVESHRAGIAERDMVVVWVVGNRASAEFGPPPNMGAAALRSRYGVQDSAFRAVLVGKDGGQKLSSSQPLAADRLFATIDAMPMRREEMRDR